MNTFKKTIATLAAAALAVSAMAVNTSSCAFCDYGEDLPVIEGVEIAEFFGDENPETFGNFYIATDGVMYGLNTIIANGEIWGLTDYGFYSETGKVWVVFNDHGTYDPRDDEIVEIFEAPTDDNEELAIYEEIYGNMNSVL